MMYFNVNCQHLSWECSARYRAGGPTPSHGVYHSCVDCDFNWTTESDFGKTGQIGKCGICQADENTKSVNPYSYETKDSGDRESFDSGAVRDTQEGKPRYDLIPPKGLKRVAEVYARGSVKYSDHNWRKGMPSSRFMASLLRHIEQYRAGDRDEDHIAQAIFNALAIIEFEGTEFDDLTDLWTDDDAPE